MPNMRKWNLFFLSFELREGYFNLNFTILKVVSWLNRQWTL